VLIIDFKTGQKNDFVAKKYQEQMQFYKAVLSKIYPNKEIKSQIIWIDFE
jgi:ATP-dependent exoDNAse (exonuclease V) beta subunit